MLRVQKWFDGKAKNISFIVTERCQLACKYCYEVRKKDKSDMTFETAKKAIDLILEDESVCNMPAVIWDFIGGEPLLKIDLIAQISDYIVEKTQTCGHPWMNNYLFAMATNGLLYQEQNVQDYIQKYRDHLSITISIDGVRERHNQQRVYRNGKGSFDDVLPNVQQWISDFQFTSVKSTIAHEDIPYIRDSVLFLYDLGITNVHMNTVYEDVWVEEDTDKYEQQLYLLAEDILSRRLYNMHTCSLFDEAIGNPLPLSYNKNWCGCGEMLAIDAQGNFYPCIRFKDFSLSQKPARTIGNIDIGFDRNRMRPFQVLTRNMISNSECLTCLVASGCGWCQGLNYDLSQLGTIFNRCTFNCNLHKARVKANNYYWSTLREIESKWGMDI